MNIANNEWYILRALWKKSPLTLKQLCDGVGKEHGWTKHGILSTLKRMETKGSITVEQTDERKYFSPAISEKEAKQLETDGLAQKAFGGSAMLLVSNIVEAQNFSQQEIDELMQILQKKRS